MRHPISIALVSAGIAIFLLGPVSLHSEIYPGAFHVGDSGLGDGFIDAGDLSNLNAAVLGVGSSYYGVHPPVMQVQELDGDYFILAGDLSLLKSWVQGNYTSYAVPGAPGKAAGVGLFTPSVNIDVSFSNTVALKAWAFDAAAAGGDGNSTPRAGYGIVFQIDPALTTCSGAFLYGRDPAPMPGDSTDKYIQGQAVFEYTGAYLLPPNTTNGVSWWPPDEANGGVATVWLNAGTCVGGTVGIKVFIPDDTWISSGRGTRGRFPDRLDAPDEIMASIEGDNCAVNPVGAVDLPADDSYHSSEDVEWWYWTGHLQTGDGRWFGFQQTFFTVSAPFVGQQRMVHTAVTDIQDGTFHFTTRNTSGGYVYVQDGFSLGMWSQTAVGGDGHDVVHGVVDDYIFNLVLDAAKAPVLQYGDGYVEFPAVYTYYYSRELMDAAGTMTIAGSTLAVTGMTWFDHQWGSLPDGSVSWEWYSLQLDDNRQAMLAFLNVDGVLEVSGSFTDPSCITMEISPDDLTVTPLTTWTSPHSGIVYPMGWDVTIRNVIGDLGTQDLNLILVPVMEDQELTFSALFYSVSYWEGAVLISGDATGRGYVELNHSGMTGCSMSPLPGRGIPGMAIAILPLLCVLFLRVATRTPARRT